MIESLQSHREHGEKEKMLEEFLKQLASKLEKYDDTENITQLLDEEFAGSRMESRISR